ncbi:MAG TPA: HlyD family type I secretion periplasmic adaptor subunit [Magnetococcales bacterium]|nr:HlyD family type I secretion periplasmic adaptor subunit [Magnetococcales bacterium]
MADSQEPRQIGTGATSENGAAPGQGLTIRMGQRKPNPVEKTKSAPPVKSLGIAMKLGKPPTPSSDVLGKKDSVRKVPSEPSTPVRKTGEGQRRGITISGSVPKKQVRDVLPEPPLSARETDGQESSTPKQKKAPLTIVQAPRPSASGAPVPKKTPPPAQAAQPLARTPAPSPAAAPKSPTPAAQPDNGPPPPPAGTPRPTEPEKTPPPGIPPVPPAPPAKEEKPSWLVISRQEPESLQSLLEPEPEEIARLKQGFKQHRFMAQSVILEESGLSNHVRSAMLAVSLVIVAFFVWASFSTMDEMASTQGQVMPSSPKQLIQHLEGGIIREILVQQGQVIKEGAVIVRMDTEAVLADLNQLNAKKASLKAQEIRIRAFLSGQEADFNVIPPQYQSFILGQAHLLLAQRSALASEASVMETRISRSRSRIENLLEQQQNIDGQKSAFSQELDMKDEGYEKGLISKLTFLGSRRDMSRIEAEQVRTQGDLTTARKELEEAVGDLNQLKKKSRESSLRELGTVTTDLAQTEEQSRRLTDRANRLVVRSPVWGVVNNLQVETVGGVIAPGALIAEIIPMDSTRRVETHISPRDIGHVAVGQSVTVKVTTYDFARYGGIGGILESVSPTTFKEPEEKEPFYKGIVRLEKSYVGLNEKKNPVLPGMTVQADIDTGSKTLMEYMLKPIYASVNKAFRER